MKKTPTKKKAKPAKLSPPIEAPTSERPGYAERFKEAIEHDREATCEQVRRIVEGSVSGAAGGEIAYRVELAMQSTDETMPDPAKVAAALDHLTALAPKDEAMRCLGGWAPEAFTLADRWKMLDHWLDNALTPSLMLNMDHMQREPHAEFDQADFGGSGNPLVQLQIAGGSTKRAVLDALDRIRWEIDYSWDDLIAGKREIKIPTPGGIRAGAM